MNPKKILHQKIDINFDELIEKLSLLESQCHKKIYPPKPKRAKTSFDLKKEVTKFSPESGRQSTAIIAPPPKPVSLSFLNYTPAQPTLTVDDETQEANDQAKYKNWLKKKKQQKLNTLPDGDDKEIKKPENELIPFLNPMTNFIMLVSMSSVKNEVSLGMYQHIEKLLRKGRVGLYGETIKPVSGFYRTALKDRYNETVLFRLKGNYQRYKFRALIYETKDGLELGFITKAHKGKQNHLQNNSSYLAYES